MRSNIVSEAGLQTWMSQWWQGIPFLTSTIVVVCSLIYLVCLLVGYDSFAEVCFWPSAVFSRFQVHRIFTSILFHGSILHVLFNMTALVPLGSELERITGSVRLFYITILLATSNALLHLLIALVIAYNPLKPYDYFMNECAIGFSGILFSMIVIETSLSGAQSRSFLGLFNVPAKWYAWILLVVFQLLMTNISFLGHLCGILSGFAYTYGLFNVLIPGTSFFASIESSSWLCTSFWKHLGSPLFMDASGSERQFYPAEDTSRFPGTGRTLSSSGGQPTSAVSPDSSLQARLLENESSPNNASGPGLTGGDQELSSERRSAAPLNTATQGRQVPVVSEEEIKKLLAMGFERTQAEVAIAAAEGDMNVAVEILMSQQVPHRVNTTPLLFLVISQSPRFIVQYSSNQITTLMTHQPLDQQEDEEMLVPQLGLVEGPQPLVEGPQPMENNSSTVENQAVDEPQASRFTWTIENFSLVSQKKLYSDAFVVGGYKWRILIFPKGNNVDSLSMYLDVADSNALAYGWSRFAQFNLAVVNQIHSKYTIKKDTQHQFNQRESDWGFTSFMPLSDLYDPNKGFLVNDTCVLEADVAVRKVIDYWSYDSKKETGYVGLKNQGATCYMNSLLQTLYHIPYFKKAVYHMPTTENDMPSGSIPLALQSLFYKLQYSNTSVATKELTKSFGWDTYDSFMQHDVQELNRVLCEKLEDKMKRTVVEGTIQKLFEGHHMNYIECINVDYKSTRKESFYDLQLDVKGCRDVYASFDKYVEVERLEGDNKYHAEDNGLQDAKKGVLFIDFPPVLQLQLKRYKFDDERVTREEMKRALEEQYGGEEELPQTNPGINNSPFKFTKYSNAYMLVYIRESDKDKIICDVDEKDIAEHLRIRLKKEQEEKEDKKRYKAQAHLYTIIKVAREEDLREQVGKDIYFDLVDHDKVHSFRIQKQMPFNLFKEEVAKEFGIPVEFQRFWIWAKRQNHTFRPNRPLTPQEETQTVGHLRDSFTKTPNAELKLFLEVERGEDLCPIPPPDNTKEDILLFCKLYDPHKEELRYVGRLFVKRFGKPSEILTILNEMVGFASDEEIELFEEIKFEPSVMCECLDKRSSFRVSQIEDGDIICFQKRLTPEIEQQMRFADVPSYLVYVKNRQIVHFRALERPKEDDFILELAKTHTYDDVVDRVAQQLGLDDPSKIRLTPHNCYSQQPKPHPIKYRSVEQLMDMLVHYNQISDILYYEVLDIPLPELQCLKTLKVAFHHATRDEVVIHNVRLPKQSTVGEVLDEIKSKVELSHPDAELRLLEVFYHKIYKIFPLTEKIENINDQYWTLRAEEIPEEEKNLGSHDRLIHVYHFTKDTAQNPMNVQNFGDPFFLVIHEGEKLGDIKSSIQKKLQVSDEEFSKWKFAFMSLGRPEYLEDSDIVSARFQRRDVYGAWEQYLGLEHADTGPKRAYAANQNRHTFEKPVKIYN
ncbi:hypothetical protein Leryth_010382 [Lithospermum erythrorhizon]|nr:hypothetical protein Leryth_010382 [Lithospermum erythrorhizon]